MSASVPTVINPEIARYTPTPMTIIGPISVTVLIAAKKWHSILYVSKHVLRNSCYYFKDYSLTLFSIAKLLTTEIPEHVHARILEPQLMLAISHTSVP